VWKPRRITDEGIKEKRQHEQHTATHSGLVSLPLPERHGQKVAGLDIEE
jgi:hypothetical protein